MANFSKPQPLTLQNALKKEESNLEALRLELRDGWMLYNREETVELKEAIATSESTVATYEAALILIYGI